MEEMVWGRGKWEGMHFFLLSSLSKTRARGVTLPGSRQRRPSGRVAPWACICACACAGLRRERRCRFGSRAEPRAGCGRTGCARRRHTRTRRDRCGPQRRESVKLGQRELFGRQQVLEIISMESMSRDRWIYSVGGLAVGWCACEWVCSCVRVSVCLGLYVCLCL